MTRLVRWFSGLGLLMAATYIALLSLSAYFLPLSAAADDSGIVGSVRTTTSIADQLKSQASALVSRDTGLPN